MKKLFFQNFRIENEEDFKKAVEKIPDFKVKAEKVNIFVFFGILIFSSELVKSMLFLNNSP